MSEGNFEDFLSNVRLSNLSRDLDEMKCKTGALYGKFIEAEKFAESYRLMQGGGIAELKSKIIYLEEKLKKLEDEDGETFDHIHARNIEDLEKRIIAIEIERSNTKPVENERSILPDEFMKELVRSVEKTLYHKGLIGRYATIKKYSEIIDFLTKEIVKINNNL